MVWAKKCGAKIQKKIASIPTTGTYPDFEAGLDQNSKENSKNTAFKAMAEFAGARGGQNSKENSKVPRQLFTYSTISCAVQNSKENSKSTTASTRNFALGDGIQNSKENSKTSSVAS